MIKLTLFYESVKTGSFYYSLSSSFFFVMRNIYNGNKVTLLT